MAGEWWDKKWYWALCALLPLLIALFAPGLFGKVSRARALSRGIPISIAMVLVYYVRKSGSLTLYRLIAVAGGGGVGFLVGLFSLSALGLGLSRSLNLIVLLSTTVAGAVILDRVMARRNYQPFV
ncbi:hypothetical protein AKJ66_04230 [candidate division MSBL1 archaeon SCGC-AAA259E22]|uniref:Uncharacterized protein n=1 Tax=candidate division MSBL1 archaeon SCGC-AAA259E22 TaxID=1698265 RepID=A0A133UDX6_9EURY|nr:hypothetical protein AKJ66_04230 [candidate division MSBL1 archaeon SCGC-AAA259E22]